MISFGIMQGRLTPSNGRGIQFFPFDNWENEFVIGNRIGIQEIEWIFDYPDFEENPLWTAEGRQRIIELIRAYNIKIKSVCWDYFMRRPFYKLPAQEMTVRLNENKEIFRTCIEAMKEIGASLIEIPLVDDSSIKTDDERSRVVGFLNWACDVAKTENIIVGLETDFQVGKFRSFLDEIHKENIVANYDSGNSSGWGYDAAEELRSLDEYVYNVHIKDRLKGNGTMKLGTGSADFDKVFGTLKEIGYCGSFIMQAARGTDGEEELEIKGQLEFVKSYLKKYSIEG